MSSERNEKSEAKWRVDNLCYTYKKLGNSISIIKYGDSRRKYIVSDNFGLDLFIIREIGKIISFPA